MYNQTDSLYIQFIGTICSCFRVVLYWQSGDAVTTSGLFSVFFGDFNEWFV
jgi:hypothetical protein